MKPTPVSRRIFPWSKHKWAGMTIKDVNRCRRRAVLKFITFGRYGRPRVLQSGGKRWLTREGKWQSTP